MTDKVCKRCLEIKSLSDFYKHSRMLDGHLNFCKECTKKRVTKHRNENVDRIREYDRLRSKLPHKKEMIAEVVKKYREKFPERYRANYMVTNAVRDGRLKKEPCVICGTEENLHAHHRDYSRPLDVVWLCCVCHKAAHKEENIIGHFKPNHHRNGHRSRSVEGSL